MDYTQLEEDLISDFGIWLRPRQTNAGYFVIGVGHRDTTTTHVKDISLERAGYLLAKRIAKAVSTVSNIFSIQFFDSLHDSIQRALVTIEYDDGLQEMPDFVEAVKKKDWDTALCTFLETDFAKTHPRRTARISETFSQGDSLWQ